MLWVVANWLCGFVSDFASFDVFRLDERECIGAGAMHPIEYRRTEDMW